MVYLCQLIRYSCIMPYVTLLTNISFKDHLGNRIDLPHFVQRLIKSLHLLWFLLMTTVNSHQHLCYGCTCSFHTWCFWNIFSDSKIILKNPDLSAFVRRLTHCSCHGSDSLLLLICVDLYVILSLLYLFMPYIKLLKSVCFQDHSNNWPYLSNFVRGSINSLQLSFEVLL